MKSVFVLLVVLFAGCASDPVGEAEGENTSNLSWWPWSSGESAPASPPAACDADGCAKEFPDMASCSLDDVDHAWSLCRCRYTCPTEYGGSRQIAKQWQVGE